MSLSPHLNQGNRSADRGVALAELFPECTGDSIQPCIASSCTTDVRQVQPGDVFVAVDDGEHDGHNDASAAVARGAIAVVCERPVPVFRAPTFVVSDSRVALGRLCHALAEEPSSRLRVIGVVGTHGKSTTIALLESIFSEAGADPGVLSTFKTADGMSCAAGISDLPSPAFLASRLANMEAAGCTHALVEVSCKSLAQHRTAGIEFDAVCVTNVTAADLDLHNTPANYRKTAARVMEQLDEEGVAVLNADDPECCRWTASRVGPIVMYGSGDAAQVAATVMERNACEQVIVLSIGNESAAIRSSIVAEHHVENCLAAAATAYAYGISLEKISRGIESVVRLSGRMERVDAGQDFPVFVDAARSPEALRSVLRTARQLTAGRVICVLGDDPSRSTDENLAVEMVVRKLADVAIITDAVSGVAEWRENGESHLETQVVADREEAIAQAVALADPGDVVVIAGSCRPSAPAFGDQVDSDVEMIREALSYCCTPTLRLVA